MRSLALTVFVLSAAFPLRAIDVNGRWTRLEAENLIVFSNARDSVTRAIMTDLQRMRIALSKVMSLRIESAVPVTIFLFDDEQAFAPLRKALLGDSAHNQPGMFVRSDDGYFIAMQTDSAGGIDAIAYHELTHSMTEATVTGLPVWYQEGIAEFYSTFTPIGKAVKIGIAPKWHLDYLADRGLMPLRTVFAVNHRSKEYNEGSRAGHFYATSWLFVHYLLVGSPQRAGQLGTFLAHLDAKHPLEESFRVSFGTTFERFEGELFNYLNRPKKQAMSYNFPELHSLAIPAPVKVENVEVRRALDHLLVPR